MPCTQAKPKIGSLPKVVSLEMAPRCNVLYVDDEPDLLEVTRIYLERSDGFTIDTATSAQHVLSEKDLHSYHAIISDFQMPGMNGIEFLQQVRTRAGDIPFIIFTGKGREDVAIDALNSGADFYLQKGGDPRSQFAELANMVTKSVEQRHARQALLESERRFRSLIQNASDIIRILDPEGKVVYDSPSSSRILGYPEGFFLGKNPFDFIHPDDQERIRTEYLEVLHKANTGVPSEFRTMKADGTYLEVESVAMNLVGVEGVDGVVITTHPISDRKGAERKLKESEEKRRALLGQAREVVWLCTPDTGRLLYTNPCYSKEHGPLPGEGQVSFMSDCMTPESCEDLLKDISGRARDFSHGDMSGRKRLHQVDLVSKDGMVTGAEVETTLIEGPDGRIFAVLVLSQEKGAGGGNAPPEETGQDPPL